MDIMATEGTCVPIVVTVFETAEELDHAAAQWMAERIKAPNPVIGLATGNTPIGMYAHLVAMHKAGKLDFGQCRTFNLDEYVGVLPEADNSFTAYMREHLFDHVNIDPARVHIPRGDALDPEEEARRYEELLNQHGPITAQVLGIGSNAHIGFNEPGTPFERRTHVTRLAEETRKANAAEFGSWENVPEEAITVGIANILESQEVLIMAKGASKAEAVRLTVEEQPTPDVPASALQMHSSVEMFVDREAASRLRADSIVHRR